MANGVSWVTVQAIAFGKGLYEPGHGRQQAAYERSDSPQFSGVALRHRGPGPGREAELE